MDYYISQCDTSLRSVRNSSRRLRPTFSALCVAVKTGWIESEAEGASRDVCYGIKKRRHWPTGGYGGKDISSIPRE